MRLFFFLVIFCTILCLAVLRRKKYGFSLVGAGCIAFLITATGIAGTYLLGRIESGHWGSISYYGGILFIPIVFIAVAFFFRCPYEKLMDYSAPCTIAALVMKVNCILEGCCGGRVLWITEAGAEVRFPSQVAELINAIVIVFVLLWIEKKQAPQKSGRLYPLFLIIYGITRFILNLFRETTPFVWILPAGNFWSVIAVIPGCIWLRIIHKKQ